LTEEKEDEIVEKPKTKRIPDLDEDETMKEFIIRIPEKTNKRLNELSAEKEVSKGSVVREAIRKYLADLEKPIEPNPEAIISDEDLNEILEKCTTYYGGFEIDGEDGFIAKMTEKGFKLNELTPEQWERVKEKLQIGLDGYTFRPSLEEFAEKFSELEPSEEQNEWLSTDTSEEETKESEETEEQT